MEKDFPGSGSTSLAAYPTLIYAEGATRAEAWWSACEQAAALGMLARPRAAGKC